MRPDAMRSTLLAAALLAAAPAAAQTPLQSWQMNQQQQLLNQSAAGLAAQGLAAQGRAGMVTPSTGVVQTLPNLLGSERVVSRAGQVTESEGGPVAIGPLGDGQRAAGVTAVFGASLFTREATAVSDAPNPNYVIVPGDRVSLRVWGAVEAEAMGVVDPSGNLFLPKCRRSTPARCRSMPCCCRRNASASSSPASSAPPAASAARRRTA
jgi:hypothetical protein